jgi:hypothetical protein
MKKLLILALLLPLYSNAQDRADWAYVTPNKDTLYLEQNEPSADLNFKIWKSDTAWQGWNESSYCTRTARVHCLS